ncbi:MAG: DUF2752 domain-containing protein [Planctomycetes bacterium]|nr:DUF2752 domain-containing protein [Planctomycetota bacterium]
MTSPATPAVRAPLTIPLADGPVAAWADRCAAAVVVGGVAAVTLVLRGVQPDGRGFGTHEQLGLEPCGWPLAYGIPCPTCGVTTAACHLVHGNLLAAFATQPFGATLMLTALLAALHAAACLVRRRSFADLLVRLPVRRLFAGAVALLLATWGWKCLVFVP